MSTPQPDVDPLICNEDHHSIDHTPLHPPHSLDLSWHSDELLHLSSKEHHHPHLNKTYNPSPSRKEAVAWMVRSSSRLGFTAQTTLLAVDYLDRFLASHQELQHPWMSHLCSVACLSLAAKMEETHVPFLDLQDEDSRFVFEPKTIQRMELLVLAALQWRMNTVTPLSFVDHMVRRIALHDDAIMWCVFDPVEVERRCNAILLSVVSDSRWLTFAPSALAASAVLYVLDGTSPVELVNQISELLNTSKEELQHCHQFIVESARANGFVARKKRSYSTISAPSSPNGVIDSALGLESSSDRWRSSPSSSNACTQYKKPMLNGGFE